MANMQLTLIDGGAPKQRKLFDISYLGATIGRSQECDWVLFDSDRFISNKHISITYVDQDFYLTDISSNGVFVNGSESPVGQGNTYLLQLNDIITLGKFRVLVSSLSATVPPHNLSSHELISNAPLSDSPKQDLLSLVAGTSPSISDAPLGVNNDTGGDLGLFDILNGSSQHTSNEQYAFEPASNSVCDVTTAEPTYPHQSSNNPQSTPAPISSNIPTHESQNTIPDDWELSDLMSNHNGSIMPAEDEPPVEKPVVTEQVLAKPAESGLSQQQVQHSEHDAPPQVSQPIDSAQQNNHKSISTDDDSSAFFDYLYEQLGLPVEYRDSVDKTEFANDLVQIINTTTQGLMALLAGRSVFKQESRLNMTMIKPQSNNPIKFSLDPSDTLEMLLVKKKPGYLSAQAAYSEALNDIQTHQMAFLAGFQASLSEILNALNPQVIEQEAEKETTRFMALKGHSIKWKAFVNKQQGLHKQVSENLNDVLSTYFSPTYEKFIENAKQRD